MRLSSSLLLCVMVCVLFMLSFPRTILAEEVSNEVQNHVIDLDQDNFLDVIDQYPEGIFIKFYSPTCGHCLRMASAFVEAANVFLDRTAFGQVNCATNGQLCKKMGIAGYPTLILVKNGLFGVYEQGDRSVDGLAAAVLLTEPSEPLPIERTLLPPQYQRLVDEVVHDLDEIWRIRRNALGLIVTVAVLFGIILAKCCCPSVRNVAAVKVKKD